jgi:23S rRNA (cytidine1920-2'-O)/16S rRNA (cytidine1409-2'-O)-methyltransferase
LRLDKYLVEKKLVESRNKARELIKSSKVTVNGEIELKPSKEVGELDDVKITQEKIFVSRAAYKLKNYLEKHGISFEGKKVLDIGSSTGGFTQVSLEFGAKEVFAVDVGKNQMHEILRKNEKVRLFEETDIRNFEAEEKFDAIVSDVSFISLLKILKKIDELANGEIILLFKPQFEVGKEVKRDKKGVVLDKMAIEKARKNFEKECEKLNWKLIRSEESSIKGKEGNIEYLYHYKKENND